MIGHESVLPGAASDKVGSPDISATEVQLPTPWQLGPGHLEAAHTTDYPFTPSLIGEYAIPPNYRDTQTNAAAALEYLNYALPDVRVTLLSDEGRTATVLEDGERVYKVLRRQPKEYSDIEAEMAALTVLSREGIAPQPIALIDIPEQYRSDTEPPRNLFDNSTPIVRVSGQGNLPIIVTEKVNVASINDLPVESLSREFNHFVDVALRHDLVFEDCEILYDTAADRAVILDVGEVYHFSSLTESDVVGPIDPENYTGLDYEQDRTASLARDVLMRFMPRGKCPDLREVATILAAEGVSGLHRFLYEHRQRIESNTTSSTDSETVL